MFLSRKSDFVGEANSILNLLVVYYLKHLRSIFRVSDYVMGTLRWPRCRCGPDGLYSGAFPLQVFPDLWKASQTLWPLFAQWLWDWFSLEGCVINIAPMFQMSHFKYEETRQGEGQATCQKWSDFCIANLILLKCWIVFMSYELRPCIPSLLLSSPYWSVSPSGLSLSNVQFYFLLFLQIIYSMLYWIKIICYFLIFTVYPLVTIPKP